jgi:hypothetical protein
MAATTISRTTWTDDDGSTNTGTAINAAFLATLYGQIDALFASALTMERTASGTVLDVVNTHASFSNSALTAHASRAANTAFSLFAAYANAVSQFTVLGDGTATIPGYLALGTAYTTWTYFDTPKVLVNGLAMATSTNGTYGLYCALFGNLYYNAAYKFWGKGYASELLFNPSDGHLYFQSSNSAGAAQGDACTMVIDADIGPDGKFTSAGGLCDYGRTTKMGEWTAPADYQTSIDAGCFTASDAGTHWYLDSADVGTYAYMIIGHTMFLIVTLSSTSVDNNWSYHMDIKVPGSKTIAKTFTSAEVQANDGSGSGWYRTSCAGSAGGTWIYVYHDTGNGSAWPGSSNATSIRFLVFFEIQ